MITEPVNDTTAAPGQHFWIYADDAPAAFSAAFREGMSRFPSGVTVVTTQDQQGRHWGFTASAFCSLSMEPPLVLVCLVNSADCCATFRKARRWAINVLAHSHTELAMRFATKKIDKFSGNKFDRMADGLPILPDAVVSVVCEAYERHPGGDHVILVGKVVGVNLGDHAPLVHYARSFHRLSS